MSCRQPIRQRLSKCRIFFKRHQFSSQAYICTFWPPDSFNNLPKMPESWPNNKFGCLKHNLGMTVMGRFKIMVQPVFLHLNQLPPKPTRYLELCTCPEQPQIEQAGAYLLIKVQKLNSLPSTSPERPTPQHHKVAFSKHHPKLRENPAHPKMQLVTVIWCGRTFAPKMGDPILISSH